MYLDLKLSTWEGKQKEIVALEVRIQSTKEQAKVLATVWHLPAPALKMKCIPNRLCQ